MHPEIVHIESKILAGVCLPMSLTQNRTHELWASFMPVRKSILHSIDHLLYSVQVYDAQYFAAFDPAHPFVKWAAVEVTSLDHVVTGMQSIIVPSGQYAVFHYKGLAGDPSIFQYIFGTWLPTSGYQLDQRPHFEILGPSYRNNDPASEEDIWIPVKPIQGNKTNN